MGGGWDPVTDLPHPQWCARGHGCGLGEHRAAPVRVDGGRRGVVVLTRVLGADGRQFVEIRTRIALTAASEVASRRHLARILTALEGLLRDLATRRAWRQSTLDGRSAVVLGTNPAVGAGGANPWDLLLWKESARVQPTLELEPSRCSSGRA